MKTTDLVRTTNFKELAPHEFEMVTGGDESGHYPHMPDSKPESDGCPAHCGGDHNYVKTGESRPTKAWFYKTEEHYVCACGKGYWRAGGFQWDVVWD